MLLVSDNDVTPYTLNNKSITIVNINCKTLYWFFVYPKQRSPTCISKWEELYPNFKTSSENLWENIFKLSFKTIRETKIQSFQFKLIHRIITCGKKLHDLKIKENPFCQYCDEVDDLRHFFLLCPNVSMFWRSLFLWWNRISEIRIALDLVDLEENILFGFQLKDEIFVCLNYCLLTAKYFIYCQRLYGNNTIDFYEYLCKLKNKLKVEKIICQRNGETKNFDKFLFVYNSL